jgi:hypothetical protein
MLRHESEEPARNVNHDRIPVHDVHRIVDRFRRIHQGQREEKVICIEPSDPFAGRQFQAPIQRRGLTSIPSPVLQSDWRL